MRLVIAALVGGFLSLVTGAAAQHMHDMAPGAGPAMSPADQRELLHFPPMMQAHMLGNMRNHVETLDAILSAAAAGEYAKASSIARTRLGFSIRRRPSRASLAAQTIRKLSRIRWTP